MAISDLIQQTIAQHITQPKVISYAPTKLDEVQGRFVASNRVYNFVLNKKGISYSPAGQGDSLLFSALYLRQDAVRKPKVGNDKCNAGKSYQCGKICLGNRRKCHKGVRDVNDARRIASILESTNQKLAGDVSNEISKKAKDRGLDLFAARARRKREGKPERIVKGQSIADIPNIPESAKPWVKSVENLATPDLVAIAQKVGFPEVTTEKGNAGAFYLSSANKVGMGDHKNSSGRSKITFLHEYGHYIDFNLTGREGYLSNTDKGIVARKADEKIIKKAQPKIADERYKLFDEKVAAKAMKDSEDLLKIDPKKLSFGNKQNEDGFKSALSYIDYIKKKGLENLDVREVNSFRANLHYAKQVWEQVNPDSPIGALKETGLDVAGYVYDLFGSITKNKVGGGHSTAYYNKGSHRQGTEAFANIIAIANSGDEKAIAVAKKFAPNMWKFVMDSIKV